MTGLKKSKSEYWINECSKQVLEVKKNCMSAHYVKMHTRPIINLKSSYLDFPCGRGGGGVKPVLLRVVIDPKAIKIGIMARLSFFLSHVGVIQRGPPLARPAIWL